MAHLIKNVDDAIVVVSLLALIVVVVVSLSALIVVCLYIIFFYSYVFELYCCKQKNPIPCLKQCWILYDERETPILESSKSCVDEHAYAYAYACMHASL